MSPSQYTSGDSGMTRLFDVSLSLLTDCTAAVVRGMRLAPRKPTIGSMFESVRGSRMGVALRIVSH